jgi:hypothetical protein
MLRHELLGRAIGASSFLSAPTIRRCLALFNFPENKIIPGCLFAWCAQRLIFIHPKIIGQVSFPAPAIYNRRFRSRISE